MSDREKWISSSYAVWDRTVNSLQRRKPKNTVPPATHIIMLSGSLGCRRTTCLMISKVIGSCVHWGVCFRYMPSLFMTITLSVISLVMVTHDTSIHTAFSSGIHVVTLATDFTPHSWLITIICRCYDPRKIEEPRLIKTGFLCFKGPGVIFHSLSWSLLFSSSSNRSKIVKGNPVSW